MEASWHAAISNADSFLSSALSKLLRRLFGAPGRWQRLGAPATVLGMLSRRTARTSNSACYSRYRRSPGSPHSVRALCSRGRPAQMRQGTGAACPCTLAVPSVVMPRVSSQRPRLPRSCPLSHVAPCLGSHRARAARVAGSRGLPACG